MFILSLKKIARKELIVSSVPNKFGDVINSKEISCQASHWNKLLMLTKLYTQANFCRIWADGLAIISITDLNKNVDLLFA